MESEAVVMRLRTIEGHPLNVLKIQTEKSELFSEKEEDFLMENKVTKREILNVGLHSAFYQTLKDHYEFVHKPILGFWGNKYQF